MTRLRQVIFVCAVLTLVAVAASGAAASSSVPFKASASGTVVVTGSTFTLHGVGNDAIASQLGKIGYDAIGGSAPLENGSAVSLYEPLTAANGDILYLSSVQTAAQTSTGVFQAFGTWTANGGTGRFSNATGSGTGTTYYDFNAGTFTTEMTGTISY